MGMAFADALVDHSDARVVMVDRHHAPGGHWLDAYPFVRLHQASAFYGVASTLLGGGRTQQTGPEAGLHERATAPEIVGYFDGALRRMVDAGRVQFFGGCEYVGERSFVSRVSGRAYDVPGARLVDATYLAPTIPASTPPPFEVGERRAGHHRQRAGGPRRGAVAVRRRRVGQDRDRRVLLAAGERRRPRRDLLGAAARPVDDQPRGRAAGPAGVAADGRRPAPVGGGRVVARRLLPAARGRRSDAPPGPDRAPDDGQGAHPGAARARRGAQHRARRPARSPAARGPRAASARRGRRGRRGRGRGRALRGLGPPEPSAGADLRHRRDPAAARRGRACRASTPH